MIRQLFVRFLKHNNIYEIYVKNLISYNDKTEFRKNFDTKHLLNDKFGDQLIKAFSWRNTKEGYDYWQNISIKWYKTLKHAKNTIDRNI